MFFAIVCLCDGFWQIQSHIRENTENATVKSTLEDIAIATTILECSLLHSSMLSSWFLPHYFVHGYECICNTK